MEPELFNTLGKIAGIAGIALGVLLLIFREIIRKSIFPTLKKDDAYRLLRLITISVWTVGLAGIAAWALIQNHPQVTVTNGVGAGHDVNVNGDIVINGENKKKDRFRNTKKMLSFEQLFVSMYVTFQFPILKNQLDIKMILPHAEVQWPRLGPG